MFNATSWLINATVDLNLKNFYNNFDKNLLHGIVDGGGVTDYRIWYGSCLIVLKIYFSDLIKFNTFFINRIYLFFCLQIECILALGNEMGRRGLSNALWCVIKKEGQNDTKLCRIIMYDTFSLTFNVC